LRQRSSVLLPEPLAPMIATTSPGRACSDTPRSTSRSPKRLCRLSTMRPTWAVGWVGWFIRNSSGKQRPGAQRFVPRDLADRHAGHREALAFARKEQPSTGLTRVVVMPLIGSITSASGSPAATRAPMSRKKTSTPPCGACKGIEPASGVGSQASGGKLGAGSSRSAPR
jgi:hypothetical protein